MTWHAEGGLKCQGADMQNICRFAGSAGTSSESEYSKRPRHNMNIKGVLGLAVWKMSVHKTYLS